ncbi:MULTISPECIES: 30S ribosomal protein S4 [Methyloversatilis]|jgi:small subunit ribosomal protein S4|uniref:30S ribosomal protein S4 n=1 Tax=Methyloversatilis TaxID=378210 RepID=UPI000372CB6B|nr:MULTISPECIES: 30S ribosomal protein S4 [Methyloversatilis]MBL8469365.1 30S ribosomal protein S4 [Methyloversatilis discipulorum]MBT9517165.1 30S ribosomal protein S4 [Methyloversatilis discipulorum]MBV5285104.1 30S ribosomal protein S4 [Methyloversatilis discipulorum]MCR6666257.1 30S ribosomal protein S4 [Methyloversatilis sp.]
MSRYTGPRLRVLRALGTDLPGLTRKTAENRTAPPGQHGNRPNRRKSEFGAQLMEKQKLRYNYGLTETQLRAVFKEAERSKLPTGEKLVELLERRLDNIVFRGGLAPTIPAARQLVRHRHVLLNGRRVNIPSIRVRVGDTITLTDKGRKVQSVVDALQTPALERAEWIAFDESALSLRLAHLPPGDATPFAFEAQKVVEFYALRV